MGWQSGAYHGFSATAQFIDVGRANDNYEDGKNGKTQYPRVADPDHTGINQLYLDYNGIPATRLRLGTQSIKIDNVRMVGNVEFRQVMQVFTGLSVENKSLPNTTVFAAHLERIKNIFGDQKPVEIEMLNVAYQWDAGQQCYCLWLFSRSVGDGVGHGFRGFVQPDTGFACRRGLSAQ